VNCLVKKEKLWKETTAILKLYVKHGLMTVKIATLMNTSLKPSAISVMAGDTISREELVLIVKALDTAIFNV
jgi:hypothetical protein